MDHSFTIPAQQTAHYAHGIVLVRPGGETLTIPVLGYHELACTVPRRFFEQNNGVIFHHEPFEQVISKPANGVK